MRSPGRGVYEGRAGRDDGVGGVFRADGVGDCGGRVVCTDPGRLRAGTRARGVRASAAAARKGAGSRRMSTKKTISPYTRPAGGWDALRNVAKHLIEQAVPGQGAKTLLSTHQHDRFAERKSVGEGKRMSYRVNHGCRTYIKKKKL